MERSVYEAAGGAEGLLQLAAAWHHRCLQDPVVSHAFSRGDLHPQHTERLAAYWSEALGGPASYTAALGDHSHVLRLHAGNGEHAEMDLRAQQCFALALDDVGLAEDPRLRRTLADWFGWMTAAMAAYPHSPDDVPSGLALPVWSWHGPAAASDR
jgi:hemoglobin